MSRYHDSHLKPNGPGDARPTALQIIQDEGLIGKLTDKVMLVTGASSGIGVETVAALHATGATVFATARDMVKGQKVIDEILARDASNKAPIHLVKMELDSLESVREGAKEILGKTGVMNVIVNNAGVMATPYGKTIDGFETQFGTNHLSHFLLFQLLKPTLLKSATPEFPSRVVSVSSIGHRSGEIRFHDFNFEEAGSYSPWAGYGQAKTANIYLANEIERRYSSQNLHATSLHPGGIATGLQIHVQDMMKSVAGNKEVMKGMKSVEQGATTSVYAAIGKEWSGKGGRYLADCEEMGPVQNRDMMAGDCGYAEWAYDEGKAGKLWVESLKMVGLKEED